MAEEEITEENVEQDSFESPADTSEAIPDENSDTEDSPEIEVQPNDPTQPESGDTEEELLVDMEVLCLQVEAILLTMDRPTKPAKIAEQLDLPSSKPINEAVTGLNEFYETHGRSFRIEKLAGGYQVMSLPKYKDILAAFHRTKADSKLSPAAMETLAIIAYRQPIIRAQIEAIRGVACGEVCRSLMDRNMIKIVGRAEEIGRPMLYGTTKRFLEVFGLSSLKDMPKIEEFAKP